MYCITWTDQHGQYAATGSGKTIQAIYNCLSRNNESYWVGPRYIFVFDCRSGGRVDPERGLCPMDAAKLEGEGQRNADVSSI